MAVERSERHAQAQGVVRVGEDRSCPQSAGEPAGRLSVSLQGNSLGRRSTPYGTTARSCFTTSSRCTLAHLVLAYLLASACVALVSPLPTSTSTGTADRPTDSPTAAVPGNSTESGAEDPNALVSATATANTQSTSAEQASASLSQNHPGGKIRQYADGDINGDLLRNLLGFDVPRTTAATEESGTLGTPVSTASLPDRIPGIIPFGERNLVPETKTDPPVVAHNPERLAAFTKELRQHEHCTRSTKRLEKRLCKGKETKTFYVPVCRGVCSSVIELRAVPVSAMDIEHGDVISSASHCRCCKAHTSRLVKHHRRCSDGSHDFVWLRQADTCACSACGA
eukprot:scpid53877/ scgid11219/ 